MPADELMESFGISFISYVSRYGYDRLALSIVRDSRGGGQERWISRGI